MTIVTVIDLSFWNFCLSVNQIKQLLDFKLIPSQIHTRVNPLKLRYGKRGMK